MLKAIITGGSGFIGYNLAQYLESDPWHSWDIVIVDDLSSGLLKNKINSAKYCYQSILFPGFFKKLVGDFSPDVIFHLAAIPRVSYSVDFPVETFQANVAGTIEILESVKVNKLQSQCKIINTSSSSIYGGKSALPVSSFAQANPQSPYALDKWQAEEWCRMYAKFYDIDVVNLRLFNVFGRHSRFGGAYSTVLSAWLYHIFIDNKSLPYLEGDGNQTRDFCWVKNVVSAFMLASQSKQKFNGESFNVAQGESHSLLECKNLLENISGKKINLELRPDRIGDVKHTLADISETIKVLGYNPDKNFEQQVEDMCDWYRTEY